jgi:glycosyltransferase involved in cell wall biosynthesis
MSLSIGARRTSLDTLYISLLSEAVGDRERMKIVYFIDHLRPDGTQTVLSQLVQGLASRGYNQTVICLNDSWDELLVDRLRAMGADVRIVGKLALAGGYGLVSVWRWLRGDRFDVVVTLLFVSDVVGRVLAGVAGVPRIITSLQTRNVDYTSLQRWIVRATMRSADAVVINNSNNREFAIAAEGARPDRIVFIPNGVCVEDYTKPIDQAALRTDMGLLPNTKVMGSVGRLTWQKGFDVLLHAFSLVAHEDLNLLIFGVGEEEARLRALAAKLTLQARVHFAGYRRDVPHVLGALDLYVHSSRFEGMPIALLEAMAAACPIVASSVDGNRDLIEDGVHGWLVPPENPVILARTIQEALNDLDEARRRAAAARQRVLTHFNIESIVVAWEKLIMGRQE